MTEKLLYVAYALFLAALLVWELRLSARWKRWMLWKTRRARRQAARSP